MIRGKFITVNTFTNENGRLEINGKIPRSKNWKKKNKIQQEKNIRREIIKIKMGNNELRNRKKSRSYQ